MRTKKLKKTSLSEIVYQNIKNMIKDGVLTLGQKINKNDLAASLEVSLTPVSEALNRLKGEGLLEQKSMQGYYIKKFSKIELLELFAVRAGLEGTAVCLCIEKKKITEFKKFQSVFSQFKLPLSKTDLVKYRNLDQDFHEKIIKLSHNSIIDNFNQNFNLIKKTYQIGLIRPPEETLEEHLAIIAAILESDHKKAQALLIDHIMNSRNQILISYNN